MKNRNCIVENIGKLGGKSIELCVKILTSEEQTLINKEVYVNFIFNKLSLT